MAHQDAHTERDDLDHQRERIEQILTEELVTGDMACHLREMLGDIRKRLVQMDSSVTRNGAGQRHVAS